MILPRLRPVQPPTPAAPRTGQRIVIALPRPLLTTFRADILQRALQAFLQRGVMKGHIQRLAYRGAAFDQRRQKMRQMLAPLIREIHLTGDMVAVTLFGYLSDHRRGGLRKRDAERDLARCAA
ncbi:MAG: hypothetical protein ACQEVT_14055 [Pseudomonadota bacterium]|uniref:hypothetical protein n=1 Tax=Roseovarius TaxID=74030 RepID=UPI0022A81025|nr:hypothetical protein [Roseovarius sp. EGI FJ00037]MCZ0813484.1 hypothetical protein [Roseovarius sp. EGI FJ00037]